jgi:ferredoxin/flavodoxin---NADP+ reductase
MGGQSNAAARSACPGREVAWATSKAGGNGDRNGSDPVQLTCPLGDSRVGVVPVPVRKEAMLQAISSPRPLQSHVHEVVEVRPLTEATYRLRCERRGAGFCAGQHANLGAPGAGVNREYSVYSGENEAFIDFLIRQVDGGVVSPQLTRLRTGDTVELHGFYGELCLREADKDRPHCFIGTGTGIAPFRSFVMSSPGLDYTIIHGVRFLRERYEHGEYEPGRYVACVSGEPGGDYAGRVTEYLIEKRIDPDAVVFLCGNRGMISDAYNLLRAQGTRSDDIVAEAWF